MHWNRWLWTGSVASLNVAFCLALCGGATLRLCLRRLTFFRVLFLPLTCEEMLKVNPPNHKQQKKKKKEPTHDNVQQQQQTSFYWGESIFWSWFKLEVFIVSIIKNNMDLLIYLHFHIMQLIILYKFGFATTIINHMAVLVGAVGTGYRWHWTTFNIAVFTLSKSWMYF